MPISPDAAWSLAAPVADVYAEAEQLLLARIARSIGQGIDAPEWVEKKLLEVQLLQRAAARVLLAAVTRGEAAATAAVVAAWNRGDAQAVLDLARIVEPGLRRAATVQPSLNAIVRELVGSLQQAHQRTLRAVPDVYRDVIRRAAPQVLVGTQTRRQAAQRALDDLGRRGITGFTDRRGRQWQLDSYVEMATRAATGRAAVEGHSQRLQARGFNLVLVSDVIQECRLCRPVEQQILSLDGRGVHPEGPALMTLDQAREQGFQHPGCRHGLSIYLPGITERKTSGTADPQGDRDRQRLRALERNVRAAKRVEAVALDDEARAKARRDVRRWQAAIREHVATTSAKRVPARERIGVAH